MNNIIIIGTGPAGLTAAIYLARSGLNPLIISGEKPGGQLINTDLIENYPGFKSMKGADLMMLMLEQAESLGTKFIYESVDSISKNEDSFNLRLTSNEVVESKSVLIATGANHRHLNIPGEKEFTNKGVSWCATCDGAMYREKKVAVIGGGNTAVMEALFLSNFAEKVYLIHRRDELRAEKIMQEKLFKNDKIECIWNSQVVEILGKDKVEAIKLNNDSMLNLSGIFIAIGTTPSSKFVKDLIDLDSEGYIIANETKTSCQGIFAAGDIVSGSLKQAIYAAGQGALASRYIEEYLGIR
ncbi:MAG: thioredoxin-disulfide reductase [Alphaproteobacteria bacterium]|nr:thioredoxin-disulfide reductase [Alphaproteobacteria bacterium]